MWLPIEITSTWFTWFFYVHALRLKISGFFSIPFSYISFLPFPHPRRNLAIIGFLWFLLLINTFSLLQLHCLIYTDLYLHKDTYHSTKRFIKWINVWWLNLTEMHNEEQSNLDCTNPRQMRINIRTVWQWVFYRCFSRCVIKPHRSHRVTPHRSNETPCGNVDRDINRAINSNVKNKGAFFNFNKMAYQNLINFNFMKCSLL